jgi:uncharacterized coiled-coil DUF342 family protein
VSDIVERLRALAKVIDAPHALEAADEIERLRDEVISMRAERDSAQTQCRHLSDRIASNAAERAEIERLRAAGDALAEVVDEWPELAEAWQEARRDR